MNANLVNILTWAKPAKTTAALISINLILWFLIRQRPLCVLPLFMMAYYVRYIWKHRISREVLVDPPDHEEWITLSSYDFENVTCNLGKSLWNSWINLRQESHILWTLGTCTMWAILAKIGTEVDFLTLLFLISNAAFVIFPILQFLPKCDSDAQVLEIDDIIPESSSRPYHRQSSSSSSSPPPSPSSPVWEESLGPIPVSQNEPISPSSTTSFYEGIVTRSMAAAAATLVATSTSVFSSGISPAALSASLLPSNTITTVMIREESTGGPESLTPAISQMPDHEVVDSDPEDEFLFDAKHFDKSSSSSISNSFEIIDDDL